MCAATVRADATRACACAERCCCCFCCWVLTSSMGVVSSLVKIRGVILCWLASTAVNLRGCEAAAGACEEDLCERGLVVVWPHLDLQEEAVRREEQPV